jgi:hypothetical protein
VDGIRGVHLEKAVGTIMRSAGHVGTREFLPNCKFVRPHKSMSENFVLRLKNAEDAAAGFECCLVASIVAAMDAETQHQLSDR